MKTMILTLFLATFLSNISCIPTDSTSAKMIKSPANPHVTAEVIDEKAYESAKLNVFEATYDSILRVSGTPDSLWFKLTSGNTLAFINNISEEEVGYKKYNYWGNLTKAYALFSVDYYENSELFFVNTDNGNKFGLLGWPYCKWQIRMQHNWQFGVQHFWH